MYLGALLDFLLGLVLLTLPFTYALTVRVGFPLKIYELCLAVCLVASCLHRVVAPSRRRETGGYASDRVLWLFASFVSLATIWMCAFPSAGFSEGAPGRFGAYGDGIVKAAYLFLCLASYRLLSAYAAENEEKFVARWMTGALICTTYTWYLWVSSLVNLPVLLLPGIEEPQRLSIAGLELIRSGTFEEGNFLGLYLLLSMVLAVHKGRNRIAVLFGVTILMVASTINIAAMLLFLSLVARDKLSAKDWRRMIRGSGYVMATVAVLWFLFGSAYFVEVFVLKLISPAGSGIDRLDHAIAGLGMFADNPFTGVGLGQYGYYYDHYQFTQIADLWRDNKRIANNVYVELLSEAGLCGLLLFIAFLLRLTKELGRSALGTRNVLKWGVAAILVVFVAYPSYVVMFMWAFLAYLAGQREPKYAQGAT